MEVYFISPFVNVYIYSEMYHSESNRFRVTTKVKLQYVYLENEGLDKV